MPKLLITAAILSTLIAARDSSSAGQDSCPGTEIPVFSTEYIDSGSTIGMTNDFSGCGNNSTPDVIYTCTPSASGMYKISLCGSSFDTRMEIRTGGTCPGITQIVCADDGIPCGLNAKVFLPLTAMIPYWIIVDGTGTQTGNYILALEKIECDIMSIALGPDSTRQFERHIIHEEEDSIPQLDITNGGFDSYPPNFSALPDTTVYTEIKGTSWAQSGSRDSDWYSIPPGRSAHVYLVADSPIQFSWVVGSRNGDRQYAQRQLSADPCEVESLDVHGALQGWIVISAPPNMNGMCHYRLLFGPRFPIGVQPCTVIHTEYGIEENESGYSTAWDDPNSGIQDPPQAEALTIGSVRWGHIFTYYDAYEGIVKSDRDCYRMELSDTAFITWILKTELDSLEFDTQQVVFPRGVIYDAAFSQDTIASKEFYCMCDASDTCITKVLYPGVYYLCIGDVSGLMYTIPRYYEMRVDTIPRPMPPCPQDRFAVLTTTLYTDSGTTCGAGDNSPLSVGQDQIYEINVQRPGLYRFSLCSSHEEWDTQLFLTDNHCNSVLAYNDDYCGKLSEIYSAISPGAFWQNAGTFWLTIEPRWDTKCGYYVLTIENVYSPPCTPDTVRDLCIARLPFSDSIILRWSADTAFNGIYHVRRSTDNVNFPVDLTISPSYGIHVHSTSMQFIDPDVIASSYRYFYLVVGVCP